MTRRVSRFAVAVLALAVLVVLPAPSAVAAESMLVAGTVTTTQPAAWAAGQTVVVTVPVTASGDYSFTFVGLANLSPDMVTEGPSDCTPVPLAPGQTATCTMTLTLLQAIIDAGNPEIYLSPIGEDELMTSPTTLPLAFRIDAVIPSSTPSASASSSAPAATATSVASATASVPASALPVSVTTSSPAAAGAVVATGGRAPAADSGIVVVVFGLCVVLVGASAIALRRTTRSERSGTSAL